MYSHKCTILLLLLASLAFPFDVAEYFYSTEKDVTVAYNDFTLDGTKYSIVSLNGAETFLLKENEPLTEESEIEDALYSYYIQMHYPSEEEIDELKNLTKQFNDSRNDGHDWKNKEEYLCRDEILFANGKITISGEPVRCVDEESCQQNALLLFAAYGEGLGLGSAEPLYEALLDFAPSSFAMDDILNNYAEKLENLSEDSVVETIDYITSTTDELEDYSDDIESTIFRTPRLDDQADKDACYLKCYAICPSFDIDTDLLDDLNDAASALKTKIAPLSGYESKAAMIYSNSIARIEYSTTEALAEEYTEDFEALNATAETVVPMGEQASTYILNNSLKQKVDTLKSLQVSITDDIDARDFNTTAGDLETFEGLLGEVKNASEVILEQYNKTKNAKNMANSIILVLDTKDLDPVSKGSLDLLKNRTADLDAEFHDGISMDQLASLEGNYTAIVEDGQKLLKKENDMPATKVLLLFRGFARNVNEGIATVAEETDVIEPQEIPDNTLTTLGLFSTILFLSLGSIILLVFLYVIGTTKFVVPKTGQIVASAFVSLLVLLLGFSVFTYFLLSKTSTDATLTEFLTDFDAKESTAIVVDLKNTAYSDAVAMESCADQLAETFEERNKTWMIYRISANTCTTIDSSGTESSHSATECWNMVGNESSTFELGYSSSNEPPKFSVIYVNKAQIKANLDYYDSCPLESLFS